MGSVQNQKKSSFLMLILRETTGQLMLKDGMAEEKPPHWENPTWSSEQGWIKLEFQRIPGKNTLTQVQVFTLADDPSRVIVGHLGLLSRHRRSAQIRNLSNKSGA